MFYAISKSHIFGDFATSTSEPMATNEHHKWLKKRDWPAVQGAMFHPDPERDDDLLVRKYYERDEHGRLPHHWMAAKAQTHTHALAQVGVNSICWNEEALTTRDNKGETPIDIALRSGACTEIIGLLSLTLEEARSLGRMEMASLYAPVAYWRSEMGGWIESRSYTDCHKWINEHDNELVREVLKYYNSALLREIACFSQTYSDSLVFLTLRMIRLHPHSLIGYSPQMAPGSNAPWFAQTKMRSTKSKTSSASPPPTSPPPPSPLSSDNTSPSSSSTRRSSAPITPLGPSSST